MKLSRTLVAVIVFCAVQDCMAICDCSEEIKQNPVFFLEKSVEAIKQYTPATINFNVSTMAREESIDSAGAIRPYFRVSGGYGKSCWS